MYDQASNQQIGPGAAVYDVNDEKVGTVDDQSMPGQYLVVQKGWLFPKDLYVPLSAVQSVDANGDVHLNLHKDDLSHQAYEQPPASSGFTNAATTSGTTVGGGYTDTATTGGYTSTPTTGAVQSDTTASGTRTDTQDIRVPVEEEQLVVGKRQEEIGAVHLHKDVVQEQQTVSVPLQREEVTVERVPVAGPADASTVQDAFREEDIDVPVMGEEAVVGKEARVVEEVRLHKDAVTEQQQISDTVRKERVTVDGQDVDTLSNSTTVDPASGRTMPR